MDFTKLTKTELLEKVIEQQALADAINEKDKELKEKEDYIVKLVKEKQQMVDKNDLKELQEKLKGLEGSIKKEDLEKHTQGIQEQAKKYKDIAHYYMSAYRDLLRIFKTNLDFAISHDELLSEKLK